MLTTKIKIHIEESVLCWLATVDQEGMPNVSPKELFTYTEADEIVIAQIASPQSVKNIKQNASVCISWINIFTQKGYKAKGKATLLNSSSPLFDEKAIKLKAMAGTAFPVNMIIAVSLKSIEEVIAPRYRFYPDTSEEGQIADAIQSYKIKEILHRNSQ